MYELVNACKLCLFGVYLNPDGFHTISAYFMYIISANHYLLAKEKIYFSTLFAGFFVLSSSFTSKPLRSWHLGMVNESYDVRFGMFCIFITTSCSEPIVVNDLPIKPYVILLILDRYSVIGHLVGK